MPASGGGINLRMAVTGGAQVRTELASLGPVGRRAGQEIAAGLSGPGAGMRALSVAGAELGQGLGGLASQAGIAGRVLSALGPAGIAAAVAIGGITVAIAGAMRVAEWSEALGDAANQLHITTTRLQEMDFAATAAGAPVESMRSTLVGLQQALGAALGGNDRAGRRFRGIFEELGITQDQLRNAHDASDLLPLIAQGLQHISSARAARIGEILHIDPEILHELEQGRDHINELTSAAQRYGVVIDASVIERNARAADSMRLARAVIDQELRVAFSNLTPAIDTASQATVQLISHLNDFLAEARDAIGVIGTMSRALLNIPRDIAIRLQISSTQNPGTGFPQLAEAAGNGVLNHFLPPGLRQVVTAGMQAAATQRGQENLSGQLLNAQMLGLLGQIPRSPAVMSPPITEGGGGGRTRAPRAAGAGRAPAGIHVNAGSDPTSAVDQFVREIGASNLIGMSNDEFLTAFAMWQDLRRDGAQHAVSLSGFTSTTDAGQALADSIQRNHDRLQEQWSGVIEGGLRAAITGGWKGLAEYMAETLADAAYRNLSNALANLFVGNGLNSGGSNIIGTIVGGIAGLFGGGGSMVPGVAGHMHFAKGGVFGSPTLFRFAAGGGFHNGILGEAGPEGVLPLMRGRDGKLGVIANGGGGRPVVQFTNVANFNAPGADPAQLRRLQDQYDAYARAEPERFARYYAQIQRVYG